jgi:hypothetical protein
MESASSASQALAARVYVLLSYAAASAILLNYLTRMWSVGSRRRDATACNHYLILREYAITARVS